MKRLTIITLLTSFFITTLYTQEEKSNANTSNLSNEETKKTNQKVVANYFEYLFKTRDFVSMENIIAKDAIYIQAQGLPYGGIYKGFKEWTTMYVKASTFFDLQIEKEPVYYTNSTNNDICISFTIKCKPKNSDREISMPISEYFELKDGLISGIRPFYFDTKVFSEFISIPVASNKPSVIANYEKAWFEADSSKRLELIKTFWAENGEYLDGVAKVKGSVALNDMIQKFRNDFPNSIFIGNSILSFENYHTWSWKIINKEKSLNLDGRDFIELDKDGRIVKLVGFWGED